MAAIDMSPDAVESLGAAVDALIERVGAAEQCQADAVASVAPHYRDSARNLVHYLALRCTELRPLQEQLAVLGIASLGHSEGYTLTNLQRVAALLALIAGRLDAGTATRPPPPFTLTSSRDRIARHAADLLGESHRAPLARIMVTLDTTAAEDPERVRALVGAGMDIARINTAHGEQAEWAAMIDNVRAAEAASGHHCRIYMDLAGPKLRTAALAGPSLEQGSKKGPWIHLGLGDRVRVAAALEEAASTAAVPTVAVSLPQVLADIEIGHEVVFDDGRIRAVIVEVDANGATAEVTQTGVRGSKLRLDKGINLPHTRLRLPSLTDSALRNLPFVVAHADIIGYSFVRHPDDVSVLQQALRAAGRDDVGIILKIETKEAFDNLPRLLLASMRSPRVGVMIARGDLAVEIGYERISEVQEEIMWLCEAAHVPAIWATEVLDKLARKGTATRAEITDAAMAARAECVMLNKGPWVLKAVTVLDDIIRRMASHQFKRQSSLRPLAVARHFLAIDSGRWPLCAVS